MPELMAILVAKRESENNQNKFFAALQGVDLDKETKRSSNAWENLKARVFSGGNAKTSDDILSLQGANAKQVGFGIGLGLEYTDAKDLQNPHW